MVEDGPTPAEQRDIIVAFLALDRYLTSGAGRSVEAQKSFAALQRAYKGPSTHLLDRFHHITSAAELGEWLVAVRQALEQEIDPAAWIEITVRERVSQQTDEPPARIGTENE